jgi:hypothetical protein
MTVDYLQELILLFYRLSGAIPAIFSPEWFVREQIMSATPVAVTDNSRLVSMQLGNTYGMAFLVASAVLYTTTEIQVVRNYLKGLLLADIGHLAVMYYVLQHESFMSVGTWNAMTFGNVGITVSLSSDLFLSMIGLTRL